MVTKVRKAVFPIGGLGTRFLPATKAMPKEMLPVVDKPLIQYAVEEALTAGIEQFIFVTSRGKLLIEDHFDHAVELHSVLERRGKSKEIGDIRSIVLDPGQIVYTRQQEALGLGHAVWCAREVVGNEPFAVLLPDDLVLADTPCLKQMADVHARHGRAPVDPALYPYWIDSLLAVVAETDPEITPALLARWRTAMGVVCATFSARHPGH